MGGPSWDKQFLKAKRNGFKGSKADWWAVRVAAMKRGHAKRKRLDAGATATQDASRFTQESVEWDGKDTAKFYRDGKLVGTSKTVGSGHILPPVMCMTDDEAVQGYIESRVDTALVALAALSAEDRTELRKRMAAVGEWK